MLDYTWVNTGTTDMHGAPIYELAVQESGTVSGQAQITTADLAGEVYVTGRVAALGPRAVVPEAMYARRPELASASLAVPSM